MALRPTRRAIFSRASRGASRSTPPRSPARTRTPGTSSVRNASCPRTSILPRTSSTIRWRARGSRACSSAAWASRPGYVMPVQRWNAKAAPTRAAGSARRGRHARASSSSCPETRRSVSACRCRRSATSRRLAIRMYAGGPVRRARCAAGSASEPPAVSARRARRSTPERGARRGASRGRRAIVRTALCVEPRDGRLLRLHAAGRAARGLPRAGRRGRGRRRASSACRCMLEGYPPPRDPRLNALHGDARSRRDRGQRPARAQLGRAGRDHDDALYEEARHARLGTEKFMLDGRHTGTGGGNHIVLGGATPADSPFLRRPDLLRSLIALLAQPPVAVVPVLGPVHRPDEPGAARRRGAPRQRSTSSRSRSRRCRDPAATPPPWLVDRAASATCWSTSPATRTAPSSASTSCTRPTARPAGCGLLELRAFEMPPHARMSLAQQLLLRALVARFWRRRRTSAPLVALGHRAARPLHAAALRLAGLRRRDRRPAARAATPFDADWFAPHFEFRFPLLGERRLRAASSSSCARRSSRGTCWARKARPAARRATSTRRSSGCRCKVTRPDRRAATSSPCNGRRVPLQPTGTRRRVRRRRALPRLAAAVGLHPTIAVHAPLVFDLVDTLDRPRRSAAARITSRIRAAATTSASRSTPTRPRAGGSRASSAFGHTPGPIRMSLRHVRSREFPYTLDLRRSH